MYGDHVNDRWPNNLRVQVLGFQIEIEDWNSVRLRKQANELV